MLDTTLRDGSSATIHWPEHLGVEGISARALRAPDKHATADRALAALRAWLPGLDAGVGGAGLLDAVRPDHFPYAEVLAHYLAAGRTHADVELVGWLRALNDLVRPAAGADGRLWPLPEWLPSTVDQETGNYDSYTVASVLESLAEVGAWHPAGPGPHTDAELEDATDQTIDALLGALAADMARTEATALRLGPSGPLQLARTRACLVVLHKLNELAPRWARWPAVPANPVGSRDDILRLAEATGMLADEVWRQSPRPCRRAVELVMLPATPLHDELMFIRSIQIFETLYRQVYRCLLRANTAMAEMDAGRACDELADATRRLELSPALYRVVTTMPRSAFAIIRAYTDGRSAIQSRAYRQIQEFCAPQPPSPVASKVAAVQVPSPTLQESFIGLAARLDTPGVGHLAAQMRALDTSWRAMKRTHWGITLKIIGKVPGTGGTAGADYLKWAAEIPLFPALTAH